MQASLNTAWLHSVCSQCSFLSITGTDFITFIWYETAYKRSEKIFVSLELKWWIWGKMCMKRLSSTLSTSEMLPGSSQGRHLRFLLFNKYMWSTCLCQRLWAQGGPHWGGRADCLPSCSWHSVMDHTPSLKRKCGFLEKWSSIRPKMVVNRHSDLQNCHRGWPTVDSGLHIAANILFWSIRKRLLAPISPKPLNLHPQTTSQKYPKLTQYILLWVKGREREFLSHPWDEYHKLQDTLGYESHREFGPLTFSLNHT